ncbi:MAG: hypothetical protein ABIS51_08480 [Sphingomonas sp.]
MLKLYKRVGDAIEYREAWIGGGGVVEHWGRCGTKGEVKQHLAARGREDAVMDDFIEAAIADGFAPLAGEDHHILLVQRRVDGFGTPADLDQRHKLEDYLNEQLGWLGVGYCDGGSIGSGTMEAACPVVDFDIAAAALAPELAKSAFSEFTIARE